MQLLGRSLAPLLGPLSARIRPRAEGMLVSSTGMVRLLMEQRRVVAYALSWAPVVHALASLGL